MSTLSEGDALTVSEHADWLRSIKRSQKTIEDRTRLLLRLDAWLRQQDPPKSLGTATEDDLATWQLAISRKATETICAYVGHALGYYHWLHRYKHRPDPTGLLVRPHQPRRMPRPITDDDLHCALRMATGPVLITLLFMAFCGLRVGEVSRVRRSDLLDREVPPMLLVHGKGGRQRMVRVPDGLVAELYVIGIPPRGNIVLSPSGEPYAANRLSQVINGWLHEHGIPDTAHSLRHWYATHCYQLTGDIRLVQELVGHESVNSTAIYTMFSPANADQIADDLTVTMHAMLHPGIAPGSRLRIVPN